MKKSPRLGIFDQNEGENCSRIFQVQRKGSNKMTSPTFVKQCHCSLLTLNGSSAPLTLPHPPTRNQYNNFFHIFSSLKLSFLVLLKILTLHFCQNFAAGVSKYTMVNSWEFESLMIYYFKVFMKNTAKKTILSFTDNLLPQQ